MSDISQEYDYLFKCIAVGDGGCGKTALTVRFAHGFFQEQYKMTIGVEFAVKLIEIAGYKTKLQIWDTGGQERFSYVRPLYYRGAMGALLVFDITNRESFEHLANWIDEVKSNIGEIPMVLVGNKSDLPGREVPQEEAEAFSKKFNMYYLESSAKTGDGVTDCFGVLAAMMIGIAPPTELLGLKPGAAPVVKASMQATPVIPSIPQPLPVRVPAKEQSTIEFEVPPIPEPGMKFQPTKFPLIGSSPDQFNAPPVPDLPKPTQPVINDQEFTIPPVPEPKPKFVSMENLMGETVKPSANVEKLVTSSPTKATPPPLVFQPPPPEVFEEDHGDIIASQSTIVPATPSAPLIASAEPITAPIVHPPASLLPSMAAKPVTFDAEIEESVPPVPTPSPQGIEKSPVITSPSKPFAIKPPVESAIKAAPVASANVGPKKTSLLAFMPKNEDSTQVGSNVAKPKTRRSAIPFLSTSKASSKRISSFVPFATGTAAKQGGEGGTRSKFMSVFIPTVDQIKKAQIPPTVSVASSTPVQNMGIQPKSIPAPAVAQPLKSPTPSAEPMVICPNCGHKLAVAYKYCNRCGAHIKK